MLFNIFPPGSSLKNILVNILIKHKEKLTVEKIKSILKNDYSKSVTYQGINKVLHQLNDEKVINRIDKCWQINLDWSKNTAMALESYNDKPNKQLYSKDINTLTFTSPGLAWEFFLLNLKNGTLKNNGEDKLVLHIKNFGYFGPNKDELKFLKEFAKQTEIHMLVENDNMINRYIKKYLTSLGINVYLGIKHSTPHSTIVYGNTVILIYFTNNDLIEYLGKLNNKIKSLLSATAIKLFTGLRDDDRFHFKLVFNNDKEVAEITRNYLLKVAKANEN